MAKTKAPTPQEIYRQRRQREERERVAYLPPGLINHGNTCFMNSVLQGLIATRVLADLVYFNPIPEAIQDTSATPIVSTRSPQLTNGHVFAGPYKQPYLDVMPIGDMFLNTVYKAWGLQAGRRREVLSPRNILTTLGRKYDQYLDFAQQDAHEFLRILLDAMRMEEFDLIKQRQPHPHPKKRRRTTITHSNLRESQDSAISDLSPQMEIAGTPSGSQLATPNGSALPHDALPLMSFVDMVFGGRLTSILVCQKCKHVSQTYEDFNDISLSIKPEDYAPHRKRERLKKFVGRLTAFPGHGVAAASAQKDKPAISGSENPLVPNHTVELLRSGNGSPASSGDKEPKLPGGSAEERASETLKKDLDTDTSHKVAAGTSTENSKTKLSADAIREDDAEGLSDSSHVLINVIGPEEKHVEFVDHGKDGSGEKDAKESREGKEKKEDSWVKIGRRISLNIGLGRPKDKEKEKEKDKKERDRKARSMDRGFLSVAAIKEAVSPESPSMQKSQSGGALSTLVPEAPVPKSRVSSDSAIRPATSSAAEFPSSTKSSRPPPPTASLSTNSIPISSSKRTLSPLRPASTQKAQTPAVPPRSKSPKPPKPSSAEQEYLRKILADVASPSANPFAIFRPPLPHRHTSEHPSVASSSSDKEKDKSASAAWLGLGARPFTGIEECLRLFTSVEVLDGENMVGCRRCWKIQNGTLNPSKRDESEADDDEEEEEEEEEEDVPIPVPLPDAVEDLAQSSRPPLKVLPPSLNLSTTTSNTSPVQLHASHSTPTVSFYSNTDRRSVSSLPTSVSDVNLSLIKETRTPEDSPDSPSSLSVISESSATTAQTTESETVPTQIQGPGGLPIPVIMTSSDTIVPPATNGSTPNESSSESQYSSASERLSHSSEALMMAAAASAVNGRHPFNTQHVSYSKDSLVIPSRSRHSHRKGAETPNTTDEGSSDDESDTSVGTSVSAESGLDVRNAGVNGPPLLARASSSQSSAAAPGQEHPGPQKKPSKPKPTLMRPAYKRYLIATPPPVLVIHLKRFQHTSKSPLMMSFSHGFKKLDDYVSFPEHLDLSPFLAPRKEDYGLGKKGRAKKGKDRFKDKASPKEEPCMYRLYAVVVHIGNMLGGHYIAYTALPNKPTLHHSSSSGTPLADPAAALSTNTPSSDKPAPTTAVPEPEPVAREWAYISDTTVRLTSLEEVLNSKAYLCMYERC